jgi:DNA polymerase-3 subunit delta
MRLRAAQLEAHLARTLAPCYTIYGDEPLIALECADAVRAAARAKGYTEREVLHAERGFDWSELRHAGASGSLFGERKLVELRFASGQLAAAGAEALVAHCARHDSEVLTLVTMPRPGGSGWWKSEWFGALETAGVVVEVQPVPRAQLPEWIARRLARQQQSAPPEVLEYLADRVEGHLLAAHQEIVKLAMLAPPGELSLDAVRQAVANVSRYDADGAAEALLAGDRARYLRSLRGLRAEGEPANRVVSVLGAALAALAALADGRSAERAFRECRLWSKPLQRAVQDAARGSARGRASDALVRLAHIDRAVKGVGAGDPWDALAALGLEWPHGSEG